MTDKLRKCPECANWIVDDERHWCKIDFHRITYTPITLPSDDKNLLKCEDFTQKKKGENIQKKRWDCLEFNILY